MAGSTSVAAKVTSAPHNTQHSTLEVDLSQDGRAAPIVGQYPSEEKIVSYDAGKQATAFEDVLPERAFSVHDQKPHPPLPVQKRHVLGMKPRTFIILLCALLALIVAAATGGGVGGALAARKRKSGPTPTATSTPTTQGLVPTLTANPSAKTRGPYANTGLAAMHWTDLNGILHKRLYYQDNSAKIRESAGDSSTTFNAAWQIESISDAVKPGRPIAAAAGYPHASYDYSPVKNVYYMSPNEKLMERQAPSNASNAWKDDNFSGLYTASNAYFLTAYWNQNINNSSQELVVLFQKEDFANGITQGRYTSDSTASNPWVANNFGFSHSRGSTFAISLQHEYTISDTDLVSTAAVSLTSSSSTGLILDPRDPLAVVAQDNSPLYTTVSTRQCMFDTPLANLIIFAVPDRSSLILNAWNCTTGFLDRTLEIRPLQKANTTYLSLSAMSDRATGNGSLYIMFDSGIGPQVEEWAVPTLAGDPWVTSRGVTVDFGL